MSFAKSYLSRYASGQVQEIPEPDPDLFLTVIIPVYNEPDFINSIQSLLLAEAPGDPWEIIIVVNEPANCLLENHRQNLKTIIELRSFRGILKRTDLQIHIITPKPFSRKKAGPGMARKIGMDEAVRRFNYLNRPEGILVSYDADTSCSSNYLVELAGFFHKFPNAGGCTLYFEHNLEGKIFQNPNHLNAIIQYELYLRYFKLALEWMSFPYANYALGSAFSVRAQRYVIAGGMGLQQAGEDFYFLQKCLPHGNFWELNTTTVFPSARTSDRVVFGTGPFISKFIEEGRIGLDVYPFDLFRALKPLFRWVNLLGEFPESLIEVERIFQEIPEKMRNRMMDLNWGNKIKTAFEESAGLIPFKKRLYHEVNLLQLIRLLNDLTAKGFPKLPVQKEFSLLMNKLGNDLEGLNSADLLLAVQRIEKAKGITRIS